MKPMWQQQWDQMQQLRKRQEMAYWFAQKQREERQQRQALGATLSKNRFQIQLPGRKLTPK